MESEGAGSTDDFLGIVDECLQSGETNKVLEAFKNDKYTACMETSTWDLVPKIVERLSSADVKISTSAQEILMELVRRASPEEMLLELIEKAESAKNDDSFLALLPPMQLTLTRLPEKRGLSLQWCLNTINRHVALEDSEDGSYESEEPYEDEGETVKPDERVMKLYRAALQFCKPFIQEVSLHLPAQSYDKRVLAQRERQRRVLITFLIQAFSQALASVDIHFDGVTKKPLRLLAEEMVDAVCQLCSDVLFFLKFMDERCQSSRRANKGDLDESWEDENPFISEDIAPIAGLGTLYYMILVEKYRAEYAPKVYSPLFILESILHVVTGLLLRPEDASVLRGLQLAEKALEGTGRPPLSADILDAPGHSQFCRAVMDRLFRTSSEDTARLALSVFKTYLRSFSQTGQYQVLKNLFAAAQEPGPRGFLVTQLKDAIDRSVKEHSREEDVSVFRGSSLFRLLRTFCSLPEGSETDVAAHGDHILATMNLVWYLALCQNSEIMDKSKHAEWFLNDLIEPLEEALFRGLGEYDQQKAALRKQLENAEESESANDCSNDSSLLNLAEQLDAVETTLNKLILIDDVLSNAYAELVKNK